MNHFLNKTPWGIISGCSGILSFYLIVAISVIQFVFVQVRGQTGQEATLFDTWWQSLLFIFTLLFVLIFAGSLAMFIRKKIIAKKGTKEHE